MPGAEWIAAFFGPLLILLGGLAGALVSHRLQEARETEQRLSVERRLVYTSLLRPYSFIFTKDPDQIEGLPPQRRNQGQARLTNLQRALGEIATVEYKQTAFDFILIASDDAAKAYNKLMQYMYNHGGDPDYAVGIMAHLGQLLKQIRRSLGNKDTTLSQTDMLRFLITDIDDLESQITKLGID
jgi:hypothetical protein